VVVREGLDGLDLHDHSALDHEVHSVAVLDEEALVGQVQRDLWQGDAFAELELVTKAAAVDALQQARSQLPVDLDGSTDHHFSDFLVSK
jgi:hypothetical protein